MVQQHNIGSGQVLNMDVGFDRCTSANVGSEAVFDCKSGQSRNLNCESLVFGID